MWTACGGTEFYGKNASDPGTCCPVESECRMYTSCFWRCEPSWYTHPAGTRAACTPPNSAPPPPKTATSPPKNATVVEVSYALPGIKCIQVDLAAFAAALEAQAAPRIEAAGGELTVTSSCEDVAADQARRLLLADDNIANVTSAMIVTKPEDAPTNSTEPVVPDFTPEEIEDFKQVFDDVAANTTITTQALEESLPESVDVVEVSC